MASHVSLTIASTVEKPMRKICPVVGYESPRKKKGQPKRRRGRFIRKDSSGKNTFNMRQISLMNLAVTHIGMKNGSKSTIPNFRRSYSITSPTKSLDILRKNLQNAINKDIDNLLNKRTSDRKAIASLKEKDCFYLKADKGNKVVILDKKDYFDRVDKLVEEDPYKKITKNPLSKMVNQVKTTLSNCRYLVAPPPRLKGNSKFRMQLCLSYTAFLKFINRVRR
nr:unnamed protein product [Callosobruchus analis]